SRGAPHDHCEQGRDHNNRGEKLAHFFPLSAHMGIGTTKTPTTRYPFRIVIAVTEALADRSALDYGWTHTGVRHLAWASVRECPRKRHLAVQPLRADDLFDRQGLKGGVMRTSFFVVALVAAAAFLAGQAIAP